MKKFLGRTYNPNTMTYSFDGGISPLPIECKMGMDIMTDSVPNGIGIMLALAIKDGYKERIKEFTTPLSDNHKEV